MKNEKMKRVAALALAGTMIASTVSPAAFAADGEENGESTVSSSVSSSNAGGTSEGSADSAPATTEEKNAQTVNKNNTTVTGNETKHEENESILGTGGDSTGGDSTSSNQELIDGNPTLTTETPEGEFETITPPSLEALPTLPTLPELPENPSNNQEINDYNDAIGVPTTTGEGEEQQTTYPEGSYNDGVQDYNGAVNDYNSDVKDYNTAAEKHNDALDDKLFESNEDSSLDRDKEPGEEKESQGLLEDNATIAGTPTVPATETEKEKPATGNEADLEDNADLMTGTTVDGTEIEDSDDLAADRTLLDTAKAELEKLKNQMEGKADIQLNGETVMKEDGTTPAKWDDLTPDQKNQMLTLYQAQVDAYNTAVDAYNHKTDGSGTLDKYEAAINNYNDGKITSNSSTTSNNSTAQNNNNAAFEDEDLLDHLPSGAPEQLGALKGITVPSIEAAYTALGMTVPEGEISAEDLPSAVIAEYNRLVGAYNAAVETYNQSANDVDNPQLTLIQKTYNEALAAYNQAIKNEQEAQMNGSLAPDAQDTRETSQTNAQVDNANKDLLNPDKEGSNADAFKDVNATAADPGASLGLEMPTLEKALAAAKNAALKEAADKAGTTVDQLDEETKKKIADQYADANGLTAENQAAVVDAFNGLVDAYNAKVDLYNNGKETTGPAQKIDSAQEAYDAAWKTYNQQKVQETYGTAADTTATPEKPATGNIDTLEKNTAALEDAEASLKTIQELVTAGTIALTPDQQETLADALGQIEVLKTADTAMDAATMPNLAGLDFSGCTTDTAYQAKINEALTAYDTAVISYNSALTIYNGEDNANFNEIKKLLTEVNNEYGEKIQEANNAKVTENFELATDTSTGITTVIGINNTNQDGVLADAIANGRLNDYTYTDANGNTVPSAITTKDGAKAELERLAGAVTAQQGLLDQAMAKVQEEGKKETISVEDYNAAVDDYNAKLATLKTYINDYNAFVQACNADTGEARNGSTTDTEKKTEVTLPSLVLDSDGRLSTAKYYIQTGGTVPFESGNTGYGNDSYIQVGTGAVKDATTYPNGLDGKPTMSGDNVLEGSTRVDAPNATGVITTNQYNNTVINLDNVMIDGKSLEGKPLDEQLAAYYANVYDVLYQGEGTAWHHDDSSYGTPDGWQNKNFSIPNEADIILQMKNAGLLDDATYQAYVDSDKTSLGVLWYVVKDTNTGTGDDGVHVDGVVYITSTQTIYNKNQFNPLSNNLSDLEKLINTNIAQATALKTASSVITTHETLDQLGTLTRINTDATDYKQMKQGATILPLIEVDELKDPAGLKELDKLDELELTKTENDVEKPGDDLYANTLQELNTLDTLQPLELLPTSGGGEEDPQLPPEEDFEGEDLVLILTDVPTEEEVEITETDTPLASAETEEAEIEEEETPLTATPVTSDDTAEIEDAEVAKAAVPKTGDESGIFLLMSALSGMALAVLSFIDRKGRHARFGSQH